MDSISKKIFDSIDTTVTAMGFEIVDIEFKKKRGDMHLTVYIDIPRGITLDDCEKVHLAIDPIIENLNPSGDNPYFLNVSSPGLDRAFNNLRDFERNYGREVEVKLYAPLKGKKLYEGVLLEKANSGVKLKDKDGSELFIEDTRIALVRPLVKFE